MMLTSFGSRHTKIEVCPHPSACSFHEQAMLATERLPNTNLEEPDWSIVRNVMVQNLPARLTQSELVSAVEELGFLGQMCYFHLPQKSHGQSRNHGYAFIGFLTPEVAGRFRDAMTGCQNLRIQFQDAAELRYGRKIWRRIQSTGHLRHESLGRRCPSERSLPRFASGNGSLGTRPCLNMKVSRTTRTSTTSSAVLACDGANFMHASSRACSTVSGYSTWAECSKR
eukprot:s1199_g12.t1